LTVNHQLTERKAAMTKALIAALVRAWLSSQVPAASRDGNSAEEGDSEEDQDNAGDFPGRGDLAQLHPWETRTSIIFQNPSARCVRSYSS
jgi:hypothetical protein